MMIVLKVQMPRQLFALILGELKMKFLLKRRSKNILPSVTSHYQNNFQMTWTNKLFQKLLRKFVVLMEKCTTESILF